MDLIRGWPSYFLFFKKLNRIFKLGRKISRHSFRNEIQMIILCLHRAPQTQTKIQFTRMSEQQNSVQSSKWKKFFKAKKKPQILDAEISSEELQEKIKPQKPSTNVHQDLESNETKQQPVDAPNETQDYQNEKPQAKSKQPNSETTQESLVQEIAGKKLSDDLIEIQPKTTQKQVLTHQQKNAKIQKFIEKQEKLKKGTQKQISKQTVDSQQKQTDENHEQKSGKTKNKLKTGHYKIFNPDNFQIKEEQPKTSIHRWKYGSGETPNKLLIHSWNVNGIRARMNNNEILPYLEFYKPDILCINETKLDEKSFNQKPFEFYKYYSYWNFPKYSLGYSGVAIFSKYPAIQMIEDIHIPEHSKQGRVITLEFQKFVLINIYVPTVGRQLQRLDYRVKQFDPAFHEYVYLTKKKFPNKTLIICGDLNVAHKELDCHNGKRMVQGIEPAFTVRQRASFSNLLKRAKLVDTFRHLHKHKRCYTWWNMRRGGRKRNGDLGIGKRLDYFLVDEESLKYVRESQIRKEVQGCDHCPIELKIQFQ